MKLGNLTPQHAANMRTMVRSRGWSAFEKLHTEEAMDILNRFRVARDRSMEDNDRGELNRIDKTLQMAKDLRSESKSG